MAASLGHGLQAFIVVAVLRSPSMKRPLLSRFVAFEAMATAARRTAKLARKRRTGNRADVAAGGADDRDQHAVVFSRLPRAGATY